MKITEQAIEAAAEVRWASYGGANDGTWAEATTNHDYAVDVSFVRREAHHMLTAAVRYLEGDQ